MSRRPASEPAKKKADLFAAWASGLTARCEAAPREAGARDGRGWVGGRWEGGEGRRGKGRGVRGDRSSRRDRRPVGLCGGRGPARPASQMASRRPRGARAAARLDRRGRVAARRSDRRSPGPTCRPQVQGGSGALGGPQGGRGARSVGSRSFPNARFLKSVRLPWRLCARGGRSRLGSRPRISGGRPGRPSTLSSPRPPPPCPSAALPAALPLPSRLPAPASPRRFPPRPRVTPWRVACRSKRPRCRALTPRRAHLLSPRQRSRKLGPPARCSVRSAPSAPARPSRAPWAPRPASSLAAPRWCAPHRPLPAARCGFSVALWPAIAPRRAETPSGSPLPRRRAQSARLSRGACVGSAPIAPRFRARCAARERTNGVWGRRDALVPRPIARPTPPRRLPSPPPLPRAVAARVRSALPSARGGKEGRRRGRRARKRRRARCEKRWMGLGWGGKERRDRARLDRPSPPPPLRAPIVPIAPSPPD